MINSGKNCWIWLTISRLQSLKNTAWFPLCSRGLAPAICYGYPAQSLKKPARLTPVSPAYSINDFPGRPSSQLHSSTNFKMSRLTLSLVRPSSEEEWSKETADGYRKHAYRTFKLPIFLLVTTATFTCLVGMFIGATYLATPVSSDSCRRFGISTLSSCSTQDTHSHESALEQPHLIFPPCKHPQHIVGMISEDENSARTS
jgi:hypothetical protein